VKNKQSVPGFGAYFEKQFFTGSSAAKNLAVCGRTIWIRKRKNHLKLIA